MLGTCEEETSDMKDEVYMLAQVFEGEAGASSARAAFCSVFCNSTAALAFLLIAVSKKKKEEITITIHSGAVVSAIAQGHAAERAHRAKSTRTSSAE